MKHLLLLLFIFFNLAIFSQTYTPMLELGKIWNMHHSSSFFPENNVDFNFTLNNMTTINGVSYFEASNGMHYREDITTKKVYRLKNGVEELILDFDLQLGDNLVSILIYNDAASKEITEIGYDTFFNIPNLKYYRTDCGEQIVEGIGILNTALFDYSNMCSLVDFEEQDFLINMNQVLTTQDYFSKNDLQLYYNTNAKELKINNNADSIHIELFSVLGKKVISSQIINSVNVSQLSKGIYFYQLSKNNSFKKGKIIIN